MFHDEFTTNWPGKDRNIIESSTAFPSDHHGPVNQQPVPQVTAKSYSVLTVYLTGYSPWKLTENKLSLLLWLQKLQLRSLRFDVLSVMLFVCPSIAHWFCAIEGLAQSGCHVLVCCVFKNKKDRIETYYIVIVIAEIISLHLKHLHNMFFMLQICMLSFWRFDVRGLRSWKWNVEFWPNSQTILQHVL